MRSPLLLVGRGLEVFGETEARCLSVRPSPQRCDGARAAILAGECLPCSQPTLLIAELFWRLFQKHRVMPGVPLGAAEHEVIGE